MGASPLNCECHDYACPAHLDKNSCGESATAKYLRIDMNNAPVLFCDKCADDAMLSGLFWAVSDNEEWLDKDTGLAVRLIKGCADNFWCNESGDVSIRQYLNRVMFHLLTTGQLAPQDEAKFWGDKSHPGTFGRS